jgi:DNA-binding XRE family transcriptional regulator
MVFEKRILEGCVAFLPLGSKGEKAHLGSLSHRNPYPRRPFAEETTGYEAPLAYCPYDPEWSQGDVLTMARKYRGFSQKAMAWRLGLDPGTLGRWERGERRPGGAYLKRLEKIFRLGNQRREFLLANMGDEIIRGNRGSVLS